MSAPRVVTKQSVARQLHQQLGLAVAPETIQLEHRTWRWMAHLPGDLVVCIADTPDAARRLNRERAVLDMLRERLSFATPAVEHASAGDWLQLRRMVPGVQVGGDGLERRIGDSSIGHRLAEDLGRAFAELHEAIGLEDCEAPGIRQGGSLPSADEIEDRLSGRLEDDTFVEALDLVLCAYRNLHVPLPDLVFTQGDPWGGNFAVDPDTGALNGLFDFDAMAIDDRNLDLRYLHSFGERFKDRAVAAYAEQAGISLSPRRMSLYHLVSAFEALADDLLGGDGERIARRRRWVAASIRDLLGDLR